MDDTSSGLYDIIMDSIVALEMTYGEVIYVLERVKYQLMREIDETLKDEED